VPHPDLPKSAQQGPIPRHGIIGEEKLESDSPSVRPSERAPHGRMVHQGRTKRRHHSHQSSRPRTHDIAKAAAVAVSTTSEAAFHGLVESLNQRVELEQAVAALSTENTYLKAQLEQLAAASQEAEQRMKQEWEQRVADVVADCEARVSEARRREDAERVLRLQAEAKDVNHEAEVHSVLLRSLRWCPAWVLQLSGFVRLGLRP
jgi:hypothetical protein